MKSNIYLFFIFFAILTSCVTQRDVEYLQSEVNDTISFQEASIGEYKLKPNDELFIQVYSLDDVSSNIFSGTSAQQSLQMGTLQPYGASLVSYAIDKEGYLHLPVVGSLQVGGKTLTQVNEILKEALTNILNQPVVSVKLVNRYVSVLGEVQNPGHFPYSQEKLTVFDAIGLAGDITEYGDRREVVITRNENEKNTIVRIDLTNPAVASSEYYYITPNDVIYVKPLHKKFWGLRQFPYTVLLSTITTSLLIYNVVR